MNTIVTEEIDVATTTGRKLSRYRDNGMLDTLTQTREEYMTGDEFERRVKERVTKFYEEHGLHYL